jgi:hypothetical protein
MLKNWAKIKGIKEMGGYPWQCFAIGWKQSLPTHVLEKKIPPRNEVFQGGIQTKAFPPCRYSHAAQFLKLL